MTDTPNSTADDTLDLPFQRSQREYQQRQEEERQARLACPTGPNCRPATPSGVGSLLGVPYSTVRNWMEAFHLPAPIMSVRHDGMDYPVWCIKHSLEDIGWERPSRGRQSEVYNWQEPDAPPALPTPPTNAVTIPTPTPTPSTNDQPYQFVPLGPPPPAIN